MQKATGKPIWLDIKWYIGANIRCNRL